MKDEFVCEHIFVVYDRPPPSMPLPSDERPPPSMPLPSDEGGTALNMSAGFQTVFVLFNAFILSSLTRTVCKFRLTAVQPFVRRYWWCLRSFYLIYFCHASFVIVHRTVSMVDYARYSYSKETKKLAHLVDGFQRVSYTVCVCQALICFFYLTSLMRFWSEDLYQLVLVIALLPRGENFPEKVMSLVNVTTTLTMNLVTRCSGSAKVHAVAVIVILLLSCTVDLAVLDIIQFETRWFQVDRHSSVICILILYLNAVRALRAISVCKLRIRP